MDEDFKINLELLLDNAKDAIYELEYSIWYNANTIRSFEDYRSNNNKKLINNIDAFLKAHIYKE